MSRLRLLELEYRPDADPETDESIDRRMVEIDLAHHPGGLTDETLDALEDQVVRTVRQALASVRAREQARREKRARRGPGGE